MVPYLISLIENTSILHYAILVMVDVSSPYTNILQDKSTEACLDVREAAEFSHNSRNVL